VTCRCGRAYCWQCLKHIPTWEGYRHFCQHFQADADGQVGCRECDHCSLYKEPDEAKRVEDAAERARARWAAQHPGLAAKVNLRTIAVGPPPALKTGDPAVRDALRWFERQVEGVVEWLYVPLEE
ncbi:hypothetical protein JCM10207_004486, partial [Rhodosporidiobolus poonsookiae]